MTTERSFFAFYVSSTSSEHEKERRKKKKLFFWNSANDRKWSRPRSSPKDVFFSFLLFRSTFLLFVVLAVRQQQAFFCSFDLRRRRRRISGVLIYVFWDREVCAFAPNRRLTMTIDDVFIFCLLQPHVISLSFEGGFVLVVGVSLKSK